MKSRKWKILITPKEACESVSGLPERFLSLFDILSTGGRVDDPQKLIGLLKDKDAVVLDLEHVTSEALRSCPGLRVISRFGEGCENIDLDAAKEYNVKITKTDGVSSLAVARHAVALILAMTHRITENDKNLKNGLWKRQPNLSDKEITIGILGFGKIGKAAARLAASFGFKVLVLSRAANVEGYDFARNLDELVERSDILSLHLPMTPQTRCVISGNVIKKLKGKYLVNTARGALVDEEALYDSLNSGGISGYAADVFLNEPISGISGKLAAHPKVICSPHIAAMDRDTAVEMIRRALENALNCLNNEDDKVVSYASG